MAECSKRASAILLTFIKLLFAIKTFVLSVFQWPLKTGFTVARMPRCHACNSAHGHEPDTDSLYL